MHKRIICCMIVLVVLLTGCRQNNLTQTQEVSLPRATQVAPTPAGVPTKTAEPVATQTSETLPDTEYLISVTAMQDRPNEMPERPPREDFFAEADPWSIAYAFVPSEDMRFLALEVTALNLDESTWQFNGSKLVLTDSTGRGYPSQLGRAFLGLMPFELCHGQRTQGWVVFEIPEYAVAKEIMYPVDAKRWIVSPVHSPAPLPDATPHQVASTSISDSNLTLSLLAIRDPGTPVSTFAYTYIHGYRPVNFMVEVTNNSGEVMPLTQHHFILMDENDVMYFISPGGASEFIGTDDLEPGETRRGEVSFDLPNGVQPSQLFYVATPFTDEFLQISVQP